MTSYADVALPLALGTPLTYAVPDDLTARVVPGARVLVPVRQRQVAGTVTAVGRPAPAARARPIAQAPDERALLDAPMLELATWVARHYAAELGAVLRAMHPASLFHVRGGGARAA